jgi:hypothetical protein
MASESDEATDASRRNIRTTGGVSVRHRRAMASPSLPSATCSLAPMSSMPCPSRVAMTGCALRGNGQRAGGRSAVQLLGYPEVVTSERAERCVRDGRWLRWPADGCPEAQ